MRLAACFLLALAVGVPTASAQYKQYPTSSDPAIGERYHVEFGLGTWKPGPQILFSSKSLGIAGTDIDGERDLGMEKQRFTEFRVTLRPFKKHKLRFQYIPIKFDVESHALTHDVIFNGIRFRKGWPVSSTLDWNAYRFVYEYDFIYRDRGFFGVMLEAKYTDVEARIGSALLPDEEWAKARAPVPAIGAIARVYPVRSLAITGELSGVKIPEIDGDEGRYLDFDISGTFNVLDNFGVQVGYRSLDVMYRIADDHGDFKLKGLYFMGVARF